MPDDVDGQGTRCKPKSAARTSRLDFGTGNAIVKYMLNQIASCKLDQMFQALADPTRRAIVERLARGPASVSELAAPFAMSLPAVVQHLQVLEASGLVLSQKSGRVRTCRIDEKALSHAEQWITERRVLWQRRLDRLGEYLAATEDATKGRNR